MPIQPRIRTIESGKKVINQFNFRIYWAISAYSGVKNRLYTYSLYSQIRVSLIIDSRSRDGGALLHVPVVGHAGLAVGPVLENRLYDGAHGEEGGRRGNAGIGINAFLSVFIFSVR